MIFIGLRLCLLEIATGVNNMPFNKHSYSCQQTQLQLHMFWLAATLSNSAHLCSASHSTKTM